MYFLNQNLYFFMCVYVTLYLIKQDLSVHFHFYVKSFLPFHELCLSFVCKFSLFAILPISSLCQLSELNEEIKKMTCLVNHKSMIFHHDNAKPHTSLITCQKLIELNWELKLHPPYSPDLASSDYHLLGC